MPHKRSAESKKKIAAKRSEAKTLTTLQRTLPALCQRIFGSFSDEGSYTNVSTYLRSKDIEHDILYSATMRSTTQELETGSGPYTALTGNCMWGSIQCDFGHIWFSIPFYAIKEGINIKRHDIECVSTEYKYKRMLEPLRDTLYSWIQDTLRSELCRRRSNRIREELVAAVWHPKRLAWRLEQGGWDAVENME